MKKSAFTLTELLIALAVIGILVAIVFPFARQAMPNSETMMAKRAFFATQNAVSSIINNYDCYPDKSRLLDLTQVRTGFGDGLGTSRCAKWPANSPEDAGTKFITMLTDQLDLDGDLTETSLGATFRTKDGMEWEVTHVNNFRANNNDKNAFALLSVDVNGTNRGPNCGQYSEIACTSSRQDYDKFAMRVFEDGKIQLLDCWAVDSVRSDKNISETTYRSMSNCAQNGETPPLPTRETDPPVPQGEDKCKFLPQPTDPSDECCDGGTHPNSPWKDTVYCDSCYPVSSTKAGVSCCAKWKANTSDYMTNEDEIKTYCCGNDEFYNSGDGAICPDCRGSNDTSLRCCSSSSRKSQITNKEDKCCSHSEIFNEVMACKPTVEPEPTVPTTPTNPTEPTSCTNNSTNPSRWNYSEECCLKNDTIRNSIKHTYKSDISPCCKYESIWRDYEYECCAADNDNPSYYCCNGEIYDSTDPAAYYCCAKYGICYASFSYELTCTKPNPKDFQCSTKKDIFPPLNEVFGLDFKIDYQTYSPDYGESSMSWNDFSGDWGSAYEYRINKVYVTFNGITRSYVPDFCYENNAGYRVCGQAYGTTIVTHGYESFMPDSFKQYWQQHIDECKNRSDQCHYRETEDL